MTRSLIHRNSPEVLHLSAMCENSDPEPEFESSPPHIKVITSNHPDIADAVDLQKVT